MQEGPIDGHATSTVPGERVIDKPEHPAGGLYPTPMAYLAMATGF